MRAIIDIAALRQIFRLVKYHAPQSKIMTVIEDNGFGYGWLRVANALWSLSLPADEIAEREGPIAYALVRYKG